MHAEKCKSNMEEQYEGLDVVRLALEVGLRLSDIVENIKTRKTEFSKYPNAVRARVDDFPSLLASSGLIPALTFYMSKCNEKTKTDLYAKMYTLISTPQANDPDVLNKLLKDEDLIDETKEGGGYNAVTAALAYALWEISSKRNISLEEPSDLKKLAESLKRIRKSGQSITIERYMLIFAQSLKKVVDALVKKSN